MAKAIFYLLQRDYTCNLLFMGDAVRALRFEDAKITPELRKEHGNLRSQYSVHAGRLRV